MHCQAGVQAHCWAHQRMQRSYARPAGRVAACMECCCRGQAADVRNAKQEAGLCLGLLTLSGFSRSAMAVPSARNSGLLRISKCTLGSVQFRLSTCSRQALRHTCDACRLHARTATLQAALMLLGARPRCEWSQVSMVWVRGGSLPSRWPQQSSQALWTSPPQSWRTWTRWQSCVLPSPSRSGQLPCQLPLLRSLWAC